MKKTYEILFKTVIVRVVDNGFELKGSTYLNENQLASGCESSNSIRMVFKTEAELFAWLKGNLAKPK